MALHNLHEMIRNLSSYIKSLEVMCESGVRLAKNFERLLSPGPVLVPTGAGPSTSTSTAHPAQHLDSDVLSQSVATWELAQKVATADSNALISELLPLLQETVQNVMKDPAAFHSPTTFEVFRSCFSAFFQIQWRFCSLYLQCSASNSSGYPGTGHGYFPRSPPDHFARSPTTGSFSSSSDRDRRESTESCMSAFSLPRSSFSGISSISSRSTSPSFMHHGHHYGGGYNTKSRNSSPSVKFTPSQPPSPLLPYGDSGYPSLFRRWSAHTHNFGNPEVAASSSSGSGPNPSSSSNASAFSSYGSSGASGGFNPVGYSRRWSVPASAGHVQGQSSSAVQQIFDILESSRINETSAEYYDDGLLDAINLLSAKPSSPATLRITPVDESGQEFELEQTTSLWPPSDSMPGVVLTTCVSEGESLMALENLQRSSHQSLRVPFGAAEGSTISQQPTASSNLLSHSGEYSLFGTTIPSTSQGHGS